MFIEMVATKKSFKKPHIDSFKIKKSKEETLLKEKEPKIIFSKGVGLKEKNLDEWKKDRSKAAKINETRRVITGKTKSAEKSTQQAKSK